MTVKFRSIQRNRLVERLVLLTRRGAEYGIQPVANADFGEGPERGLLGPVLFPDGPDETHHPRLGQVLTVAAGQKKWARTGADQTVVPRHQSFLRVAVSGGRQTAKLFVCQVLQGY